MLNKATFFELCSRLFSRIFRDREKHSLITGLLAYMVKGSERANVVEKSIARGYSPEQEMPRKIYFQMPKAYCASTLSMMSWNPSKRPTAMNVWCDLCQCSDEVLVFLAAVEALMLEESAPVWGLGTPDKRDSILMVWQLVSAFGTITYSFSGVFFLAD